MNYEILKSNFSEVYTIWRNNLWPKRVEPIEETSALLFRKGIDMGYRSSEVFFVKIESNDRIIGVCSGQRTGVQEFRSRGLWVLEAFRKKGLGSKLFYGVEKESKKRGGVHLWTLAREESKGFYESMGMRECEKTDKFEYGPHFWMSKHLK